MPFLQYADNRALREQIFKAYTNRGNNGNDADNKAVVRELLEARLEKARLMGYEEARFRAPFRFLMHSSSAMHRLPKPSAIGKNAVLCELSTAVCFP